jgi:flagellin-like hook-associated protein FlgL
MSISGFPAFDRVSAAAASLRAQLAEQTAQSANGRRASTYAGLGDDARRSVDLRAELSRRAVLSRSAAMGEGRATHAQSILSRLTNIAKDMGASAGTLLGLDSQNASIVAASARSALQEVQGLLNERYQGEAVFGGGNPDDVPVPGDIESSGLFTQIGAAISGMAPGAGGAVRTALRNLGASDTPGVTPFSAHATASATGAVADPRRAVPVEEGVTVAIGLYPNRNSGVSPSTDADTTGSWARDIIAGLAIVAQLDKAPDRNSADFKQLVQGAIGMLRAGMNGVATEAGALGNQQSRLADARKRGEEVTTQIELQVGQVEDVDIAAVISRMQTTRTQLETSYRSLSMLADLSLTRFLR